MSAANAVVKKQVPVEVVKTDSSKMERVFELSVEEIERVLNKKCAITDVTKIASSALATYSRIRSTEVHELGLQLVMARMGAKKLEG